MKILFKLVTDKNTCKRALSRMFFKRFSPLFIYFGAPSFVVVPFSVPGNFYRYSFEKLNFNLE